MPKKPFKVGDWALVTDRDSSYLIQGNILKVIKVQTVSYNPVIIVNIIDQWGDLGQFYTTRFTHIP